MSKQQAEILFICGSPRSHASEALLALLEQGVREAGARSRKFLLSKKYIAPCIGCGYCEKTGTCILADASSRLYVKDDYEELLEALSYADALAVVAPLFFSGPPAQLKALYDRMQPFWSRKYILKQEPPPKHPSQIFILGGGGDAHGYDPMVTISRSALAVAGFSLEKIQNFVGFKHPRDVDPLPTDEEASGLTYSELAHLRKAVATQREFEQRAYAAGGAFARFVSNHLAESDPEGGQEPDDTEPDDRTQADDQSNAAEPIEAVEGVEFETEPVTIVNQVDSEFEALKQTARANKSPKANQTQLDAVVEEAVAAIAEHEGGTDASLVPDETDSSDEAAPSHE